MQASNQPYTEAELAEVHTAVVRAIAERDAEAFSLLYEPDAALIYDGTVIAGREAIRTTFAEWLDQGFCEQQVKVHALLSNGDVAVECGTAVGVFNGAVDAVATSNYTIVHRRQPSGAWLMVWDAWAPAATE
jgi:uncharacterized protein (TIGR02246 family)